MEGVGPMPQEEKEKQAPMIIVITDDKQTDRQTSYDNSGTSNAIATLS